MSEKTHEEALALIKERFMREKPRECTEAEAMAEFLRAYLDVRGLAIVPRIATDELLEVGINAREDLFERMRQEGERTDNILVAKHPAGTIYDAMVAAAPDPFAPSP